MEFLQINFYVRVPLNNKKKHFHKEKKTQNPIFIFFVINGIKIIQYPFNGIFHTSFMRARTLMIPKTQEKTEKTP